MSRQTVSKPQPPKKKSSGGTLIGLFIGLVIGLVCAFGIAWYLQKSPLPFMDKNVRGEPASTPQPAPSGTPLPLPGKPGEKPVGTASEKPRFEFYKILPGGEAAPQSPAHPAAPVTGDAAGTADAAGAPPPPATSDILYLQAGAFQKSADADNLKAKLALMGFEASVLEANLPDKGTMYRVRVGPFAKPDEMNRARNQLSQGGIQASLVKTREVRNPPAVQP